MKTEVMDWVGASESQRQQMIASAAERIRGGALVAYPTETVYGLGASGLDREAVQRIYDVKGRPLDRPLLLAVTGPEMLDGVVREVSEQARSFMDAFWPGPLSLVLPRSNRVPDAVTAGREGVGIRCPDHPAARALIREAGVPVTAPSANTSGEPSCRAASEVVEHLGGRIECVIDGGRLEGTVESTVLDLTGEVPVVLRRGALSLDDLKAYGPVLSSDRSLVVICTGNTCRSPVAAAILSDRLGGSIRVESAGVRPHRGSPATEESVIAASEAGYDLDDHRARGLDEINWDGVGLALTMTAGQAVEVRSYLQEREGGATRVLTLGGLVGEGDVPDPIGGPLSRYQNMVARLEQLVARGMDEICHHM